MHARAGAHQHRARAPDVSWLSPLQVLTNILVQRHTPWGAPKLTLARWLHNVIVTCMLVEVRTAALTLILSLMLALALALALALTLAPTLTLSLTRHTPPRRGRASSGGSSRVCVTTTSTTATAAHPTSSSSATQHGSNALRGQCPSSGPAPSRGAPGGSGRQPPGGEAAPLLSPSHCLGCSS